MCKRTSTSDWNKVARVMHFQVLFIIHMLTSFSSSAFSAGHCYTFFMDMYPHHYEKITTFIHILIEGVRARVA